MTVYFWQRIISPHMVPLASALVDLGVDVIYVAEQEMSVDRKEQGWVAPNLGKVRLLLCPSPQHATEIAETAGVDSVHICQSVRANGTIRIAQSILAQRGLQQWAIIETVDDVGWRGVLKRILYAYLLQRMHTQLTGILAIGWRTSQWIIERGFPAERVFPFAYFLDDVIDLGDQKPLRDRIKFLFVGQLIERKRVDLLLNSFSKIHQCDFDLMIIGDGVCKKQLMEEADRILPHRVHFLGILSMDQVREQMRQADCLVLPSRHDGWGAVVSEALMVGTPVICSDACGSAEVVEQSGVGGVFSSNDPNSLKALLENTLECGIITADKRAQIAAWATSLGAKKGANYLKMVISQNYNKGEPPQVPWRNCSGPP
jgi:glycosyltransferase involved in cell wall biosynthesis